MMTFPSVPRIEDAKVLPGKYHLFYKYDGQQLRVEWSKKRGFYKWGSKGEMRAENDRIYGAAFALFRQELTPHLEDVLTRQKHLRQSIESATIFAEYWGDRSIAGMHEPGDRMRVTLVDLAVGRAGSTSFVSPEDFLALTAYFPKDLAAQFLGKHEVDGPLVQAIRANAWKTPLKEGVVAKALRGNQTHMVKIKTNEWKERVRAHCAPGEAEKILIS